MSLLAHFIRTYTTFLLVSHLSSFISEVHAQAAPDFFWMDQSTTNKPLKAVTSKDNLEGKEETHTTYPHITNVFCRSPPNIQHGELNEAFSTYTVFPIGAVVGYKCKTNYEYVPGTVNTTTCMSNGSWSQPSTFCKANFCSSVLRLDYAEPQDQFLGQTMYSKNSKVTYNCRPGFSRVPSARTYATCIGDEKWTTPGIFCRRKSCGNPGDVDNAEMKAVDFFFGSRVTYICNAGYRMITKRDYRDCLADGTWSNMPPICEVQLCSQPPDIINGAFYPIKEEYTYLDVVIYQCNRNLALIGERSISCKEDGKWSSNAPDCRWVNCFNPQVPNARKISGSSGPYNLNSVVRFVCYSNYVLNGSDIVRCNENNQWEPALPKCLGFCNAPNYDFAELEQSTRDRLFVEGTTLKFKCKNGFNAVPDANNVQTCLGKEWTQNQFCTPVVCGNPGPIDNGYVKNGSFDFGSNAIFECNTGYKIKYNRYRQCLADGSWSFPIPECEVKTCPSLKVTLETSFSPVKTQYQYGDTLNFSCEWYLQLTGEPKSICNHEGRWSPDPPSCKSICYAPPELEYAKLSDNYENKETFFEDENITYTCKKGYIRDHQSKSTSTCLDNFEWSRPNQFCSRISCGPPEEITNAVYEAKDFFIGSEAVYKCNKGYKMVVGINSRKCLDNRNWSGPVPRCRVQICPPPEDLVGGSYSAKKKVYIYQDSVTYKCDNLTLVGEASVSCTDEGTWTFGAPDCKAVCKSPPELKYGELELERTYARNQYFNVGTSLTYKCRPGYISTKNKSNAITCLDNLKWSEPETFCTRLSCGNPGDIEHGQMHFENFLFESRVNYTCISGYTMMSRRNYRYCQADGTWSGTPPVCKASICDNIWELQEETRKCTSTPDDWIKYLQVHYLYLQIENLKLDIEIKKKKLNTEEKFVNLSEKEEV
ncbi:C4b-binding protein alpha chain-like isoform 1-T2 [Mantella aurantiaca]